MSSDEYNKQFNDERFKGALKPQSERQRDAFEFLVREGMATAKKMGRENVTEDQVRREIRAIVEPAENKMSAGAYKSKSSAPKQAADSHDYIKENPNLEEI